MDISKNKDQLKKNIDPESSENNIETYIEVIDKVLKNKKIELDDVSEIKIDILTKTKKYKSLSKDEKEKVFETISRIVKDYDNTTAAYFNCSNCRWTKEIKKGTKIITKSNMNTVYNKVKYQSLKKIYGKQSSICGRASILFCQLFKMGYNLNDIKNMMDTKRVQYENEYSITKIPYDLIFCFLIPNP